MTFQFIRHATVLALSSAFALTASSVWAQLTIDIVGIGSQQIPVAVTSFAGPDPSAQQLSSVIEADLVRSGMIKAIIASDLPRNPELAQVAFNELRNRGADATVIGSVQPSANGQFNVSFRLVDVPKQTQLAGLRFTVPAQDLRKTAHRIADIVYEALTGDKGVFSTRLAYVSKAGGRFQLVIADSDGANAVPIVNSTEPIISPAWSPNGNRLAYVSFEGRKPSLYVQNVSSGERRLLINARGNQSAPSWSPDGLRVVFASSQAGGTQLFIANSDGSGVRRLSNSGAIDTAPNWASDGRIYFMSDRGGSPQIYRMSPDGGGVERVSFEGTYNANPRVSSDAKSMVFVKRDGPRDILAILDFSSRQVQTLTQGPNDESPSFAPNGKVIVYASVYNGKGILATVSADGRVKQRLGAINADVREPAWGPLPQ